MKYWVKIDWIHIWEKKNPNKIIKKNSEYIKNGYGKSHYKLINQIIKDVQKNKSSSIIGAGESYKTSALIHAMYSSYEKNKPIKLIVIQHQKG